jgi:hypothetical protein
MTESRILRCHCGAIEINIKFDNGLENIRRCDCSLCRRKGAVMAAIALPKLTVIKGLDNLSCYQWNTKVAKHYFCKTCGIYTHHKRRSNPNQYGINIACIDGVDPYSYKDIPIGNGNLNAQLPKISS